MKIQNLLYQISLEKMESNMESSFLKKPKVCHFRSIRSIAAIGYSRLILYVFTRRMFSSSTRRSRMYEVSLDAKVPNIGSLSFEFLLN